MSDEIDYCQSCGLELVGGRCDSCQSTREELTQRPTEPLPDYATWIEGQRRLATALGLREATRYLMRKCDLCKEPVPAYSHVNLCEKHRAQYLRFKNAKNQKAWRERKKQIMNHKGES